MNSPVTKISLLLSILASGFGLSAAQLSIRVRATQFSALNADSLLLPRIMTGTFLYAQIVAVNGAPAGGIWTSSISQRSSAVTPDGYRLVTWSFAVTSISGARIGEIVASLVINDLQFHDGGLIGVATLPVISAGGAYFGAQGLVTAPIKDTDHSGPIFHVDLTSLSLPSFLRVDQTPAIAHASDGSLVTANNPAQQGEILTAYTTSLLPEMDSSPDSWPSEAKDLGLLPINFIVGGSVAEILYIGAVPGPTGRYQVNLRVPTHLRPGTAEMEIRLGFIPGPAAMLSVV